MANEVETNRFELDATIDERTLREHYLRPFETLVKSVGSSRPLCLMTAYHSVNGEHCDRNHILLNAILRQQWGFDGLVMSDWGGTNSLVDSLIASCDLEMPGPPIVRGEALLRELDRVRDGLACDPIRHSELLCAIDASARRVLTLLQHLNALDNPLHQPSGEFPEAAEDNEDDRQLVRRVAADGIVLLKNDMGHLPLDYGKLSKMRKILIVGPNATPGTPGGGGSASGNAHYLTTPLASLRKAIRGMFPTETQMPEIVYTPGCFASKYLPTCRREEWGFPLDERTSPGFFLEFFHDIDCAGEPVSRRRVPSSYIDLVDGTPSECLTSDGHVQPYTVRVASYFTPTSTGRYAFSLSNVGDARLWVEDRLLIDNRNWMEGGASFFGHGSAEKCAEIDLTAGVKYCVTAITSSRLYRDQLGSSNNFFASVPSIRIGVRAIPLFDMIKEATVHAKEADMVLCVIGLDSDWEGEGHDRTSLSLPGDQDALVSALLAANKSTVIINQSGAPVSFPWLSSASTVLQAWYGGQEAGNAIADVVVGRVNPSGRLPMTWPRSIDDVGHGAQDHIWPGVNGKVVYEEGIFMGYRHYDEYGIAPEFPFGFGLSYSAFEYSSLIVSEQQPSKSWEIRVSVRNKGKIDGYETVQIYSGTLSCTPLSIPKKQLKAFEKIWVPAGTTVDAICNLDIQSLASWDPELGLWATYEGQWRIWCGSSVHDIHLAETIDITSTATWTVEDFQKSSPDARDEF